MLAKIIIGIGVILAGLIYAAIRRMQSLGYYNDEPGDTT